MVALVLVDALMVHRAQCDLFERSVTFGRDAVPLNPLGKKLEGYGVAGSPSVD